MPNHPGRQCEGCQNPIPAAKRAGTRFCSPACRPSQRPERQRQYQRAYRATPKGQITARSGAVRRHGLTLEDYDTLLAHQGGVCAICQRPPKKVSLAIDHDHHCCPGAWSCGKCVRGLLCSYCNHRMLGRGREDPARHRRIADYLEAPPWQKLHT